MYVELGAYQHHVFMDWRFVDDERWQAVHDALNGAGVESMQAKWEEMFGEKARPERSRREEVVEEVKVKKPRKKAVGKKLAKETKKTHAKKKTVAKPKSSVLKKSPGKKNGTAEKKTTS